MTEFHHGNNNDEWLTLKNVGITRAICDEMEQNKTSSLLWNKKNVFLRDTRGETSRFLRLLLSDNISFCCHNLHLEFRKVVSLLDLNGWKALGQGIRNSCALKRLAIQSTEIPDVGMRALADGLKHQSSNNNNINKHQCLLEVLDLQYSTWTDAANDILARGLQTNHLQCLNLANCHLSDTQVARLVLSLQQHPCLQILRLSHNCCGDETSTALARLLQDPHTKLQELYLDFTARRHHQRRSEECKLQFALLADALRYNKSLCRLNLADTRMDDDDLEVVFRALMVTDPSKNSGNNNNINNNNNNNKNLSNNSSLQHLILARNLITDNGLSRLLYQWLPHVRCLQTVDLSGNLMEFFPSAGTTINNNNNNNNNRTNLKTIDSTTSSGSMLRSRLIKAMVDLQDVELLKAVSLPEQVPVELWPALLHRLQQLVTHKTAQSCTTTSPSDLLYFMLRGPLLQGSWRR